MSYTSDDQLLAPSIDKILEGIDEFIEASNNRIEDAGEWKREHLQELADLGPKLQTVRSILSIFRLGVR